MFGAENGKCANIQSIFIQNKHFCPEKLSSGGHSHSGCSLAVKHRKRFACDVFETHSDFAHVSDMDCWAQNGFTRGCVIMTFKLFD